MSCSVSQHFCAVRCGSCFGKMLNKALLRQEWKLSIFALVTVQLKLCGAMFIWKKIHAFHVSISIKEMCLYFLKQFFASENVGMSFYIRPEYSDTK